MQVTASLVLNLFRHQFEFVRDLLHGPSCPRRREAYIIPVDTGRAPVQTLVACVTDEPKSGICAVLHLRKRTSQLVEIGTRNHRLALLEPEAGNVPPGRVINSRHSLRCGICRTQLRLVGQLLQCIVLPELHLDPAIQRTPLSRRGAGRQTRITEAIAFHGACRQIERFLHRKRYPMGTGP